MVRNGGDEGGNMGGGMGYGASEARWVEMECWEWCAGACFRVIDSNNGNGAPVCDSGYCGDDVNMVGNGERGRS